MTKTIQRLGIHETKEYINLHTYYKCHCVVDYNSIVLCTKHFQKIKPLLRQGKPFKATVGEE